MANTAEFGTKLTELRKARGFSQGDLRKKLEDMEYPFYSKATVCRWELGKSRPREDVVDTLETILCAPPGLLLEAAGYLAGAENKRRHLDESRDSEDNGQSGQLVESVKMMKGKPEIETLRKQAIQHDEKIFRKSDKILSELDVRKVIYNFRSSNAFLVDDHTIWFKFLWFFDFEENQYILNDLRSKCDDLLNSMAKLTPFINEHFFPSDRIDRASELWISGPGRDDFEWDDARWGKYYQLESELHELADGVDEAYKLYRTIIREMLFV